MKTKNILKAIMAAIVVVAMASCGTSQSASGNGAITTDGASTTFVKQVITNAANVSDVVASCDLTLEAGSKNIGCDGKLSMRRGKVIRLQMLLPLLRTEIARIDFTPDYVLLVDRYHKEYIKAGYDQVSFLADNGISYYSLEAMFWNQLFLPGKNNIDASDARKFKCTDNRITYKNGHLACTWDADPTTATIKAAQVVYQGATHGQSTLLWNYANFSKLASTHFPMTQQLSFTTAINGRNQSAKLTIKMNSLKTTTDWDADTQLSSKYRKIEAQDILRKLLSIQ